MQISGLFLCLHTPPCATQDGVVATTLLSRFAINVLSTGQWTQAGRHLNPSFPFFPTTIRFGTKLVL